MRSPVLFSILIAATIGACEQSLTHDMTGTGGTGTGRGGTGGTGTGGTEPGTGGSGSTCNNDPCECRVAGKPLCGGACVDVTSDNNNCGTCGHACAAGQTCLNGSCAAIVLGCPMSDPPASSEIATFASDGGIAPLFGVFAYGAPPEPIYTIAGGVVNVMDTVEISATNDYQGFGFYFNGNETGTDCVDASSYTGVSFLLSGSLMGMGCTMQFSINDSEHAQRTPGLIDPKAAGPQGSYAPQLSIPSAQLTATPTTIMVPFAGIGAPANGSPAIPIDPSKLVGVQWQMSTPVASDGGAAECVWNINVSNVRFY